jgi:dTDP-4-amino-4,6-dideoxygalactose transaminase
VKKALHDAGVQTSHHYTPIHKFTFYKEQISRGRVIALPAVNAETFSARALTLPLFPGLSPEAVDEICSIVAQAVRRD